MSEWMIRKQEIADDSYEEWEKGQPICAVCKRPIVDEEMYLINGDPICPDCLLDYAERWLVETEKYRDENFYGV